jgi:putative lipoic acid-binding regulatory protein
MNEEGRPEIKYPCPWTYAVIGWSEDELRQAIREVVGSRSHTTTFSKKSSAGKFCSVHLVITVMSETDRNYLFELLKGKPAVRMVI